MPTAAPVAESIAYGGQAVVEGVMMRGGREMAVAVRGPAGEIVVWSEPIRASRLAVRVRRWPGVRGAVLLWDTMTLGMRALVFSAAVGAADAPRRGQAKPGEGSLAVTVALSLLFSVALFFVLPMAAAAYLSRWVDSPFVCNLIEGLIRLGLLVGYVYSIGFLRDVRRVYAYHGAEHKTIHAWEAGAALDVASVRRFPLEHPRCGTGFMLVVMLLSLLVFLALGDLDPIPRVVSRIALVPVVAGFAYELLKLAARRPDHPLARPLLAPGMKLQRLTTREPDDAMLEVAIAALLRVLVADGRVPAGDPRLGTARSVDAAARPLAA